MERLCDLLFEVSNEDRLRILIRLGEGPMNVTGLSRELGITTRRPAGTSPGSARQDSQRRTPRASTESPPTGS